MIEKVIITREQFHKCLEGKIEYDYFVIPLYASDSRHPKQNKNIGLYIKKISSGEEWITDPDFFKSEWLEELERIQPFFILGLKEFSYFYKASAIDIEMHVLLTMGMKLPEMETYTNLRTFYTHLYPTIVQLNQIVPLSKQLEEIQNWIAECDQWFGFKIPISPAYPFYHKMLLQFQSIEKCGIAINNDLFRQFFPNAKCRDYCYTQYNLLTQTGRPSNRFGGINYAALSKDSGCRESFISRFESGSLVEFDFSAYHPHLIAELIEYKFPTNDVYQYFASLAYPNKEITEELKAQMKEDTFRFLYSGNGTLDSIDYFEKVQKLAHQLYSEYTHEGFVTAKLSGRKIFIKDDPTPFKVLNYYIQNYETERNSLLINDIIVYCKDKNLKTRLVLYTYDSLLIDSAPDEKRHRMNLRRIISKGYPLHIKVASNYQFGNLQT